MGHNLLFLPKDAEPSDAYWSTGKERLFDEKHASILASRQEMASRYFVSVIQQRRIIEGKELILTGIKPVPRKDETAEKGNMIKPLLDGFARIGFTASEKICKGEADKIIIDNREFVIESVLPEKGDQDDYRIYIDLSVAQKLIGVEGKIHYILGFLCQHARNVNKTLELEKIKLEQTLPNIRLIVRQDLLQGRYLARMTTHETLYHLLLIAGSVTLLIIIISGLQEITERKREAGILTAMGAGMGYLASLYFIKIAILAFFASITGFTIGSKLAVAWSSSYLVTQTIQITTQWQQLPEIVAKTVAIALVAQCIPLIKLIKEDPSAILVEE